MTDCKAKDIWEIIKLLGFKDSSWNGRCSFAGVFALGDFEELYDYHAGLVTARISTGWHSDFADKASYIPCFSISTVDDGVWQAFTSTTMSVKDSNKVVMQVINNWPIEWTTKLPTEKLLNDYLMQFGMLGKYTG
jgi:hypothetical protein